MTLAEHLKDDDVALLEKLAMRSPMSPQDTIEAKAVLEKLRAKFLEQIKAIDAERALLRREIHGTEILIACNRERGFAE